MELELKHEKKNAGNDRCSYWVESLENCIANRLIRVQWHVGREVFSLLEYQSGGVDDSMRTHLTSQSIKTNLITLYS